MAYFLESITGILELSGVCLYVPSSRKNEIIAFKKAKFLLYQLQLAFFLIPDTTLCQPKLMHSEQGEKGSTRDTNGKEAGVQRILYTRLVEKLIWAYLSDLARETSQTMPCSYNFTKTEIFERTLHADFFGLLFYQKKLSL